MCFHLFEWIIATLCDAESVPKWLCLREIEVCWNMIKFHQIPGMCFCDYRYYDIYKYICIYILYSVVFYLFIYLCTLYCYDLDYHYLMFSFTVMLCFKNASTLFWLMYYYITIKLFIFILKVMRMFKYKSHRIHVYNHYMNGRFFNGKIMLLIFL